MIKKYSIASEASGWGGVQGPFFGPLVGSRGKTLAGVQGAEPPEAPGVLLSSDP